MLFILITEEPGVWADQARRVALAHGEAPVPHLHPLLAYCDNTGEPLAGMLRPSSAGSNTAANHLTIMDAAIARCRPRSGGG